MSAPTIEDRIADVFDAANAYVDAVEAVRHDAESATLSQAIVKREAAYHDLALAVRGECRVCDSGTCEGYIGVGARPDCTGSDTRIDHDDLTFYEPTYQADCPVCGFSSLAFRDERGWYIGWHEAPDAVRGVCKVCDEDTCMGPVNA